MVWAPVLIISGELIERSLMSSGHTETAMLVIAAAGVIVAVIIYWARRHFALVRK